MAQIKKFQNPSGPIEESTKVVATSKEQTPQSKYGKIIKNGVDIEVTDRTLAWLDAQGYYGQQISNKLRQGIDQYLDVDEDGSGIIRDIDLENPDLKERQQQKSGMRAKRIEGRRLREAREDIQKLVDWDYNKFIPIKIKKGSYSLPELTVEFITEDNKKRLSPAMSNSEILARLDAFASDSLNIPEDKEFADYEKIKTHINTISASEEGRKRIAEFPSIYEYLKNRLQNGTVDSWDWSILKDLGIVKKEVTATGTQKAEVDTKYFENTGASKEAAEQIATYFTKNKHGNMVAKKELKDELGVGTRGYMFTKNDGKFAHLAGKWIIDDILREGTSKEVADFLESSEGKQFTQLYNQGQWAEASKIISFKDKNITFAKQQPNTLYNIDFKYPYLDLSGTYNIDNQLYRGSEIKGIFLTMKRPEDGSKLYVPVVNYALKPKDSNELQRFQFPEGADIKLPIGKSSGQSLFEGLPINMDEQKYVKWGDYSVAYDRKNNVFNLGTYDSNGNHTWLDNFNTLSELKNYVEQQRIAKQQLGGIIYEQPTTTTTSNTSNYIDDMPPEELLKQEGFEDDVFSYLVNLDSLSAHKKSRLLGLAADLAAVVAPGKASAIAGTVGTGAHFIADLEDGFQMSDLKTAALDMGLNLGRLVGIDPKKTKVTKTITKLGNIYKTLAPMFIAWGMYDAFNGIKGIHEGNFSVNNIKSVLNGILTLKNMRTNSKLYKEKKAEYLARQGKNSKGVDKTLESLKSKSAIKYDEVVQKTVDKAVKLHPEWTSGKKTWFDKSTGRVTNYSSAWKDLREDSKLITDELINGELSTVTKLTSKVSNIPSNVKNEGLEWLKSYFTPNYTAPEEIEVNRRGGKLKKVKKYEDGDDIDDVLTDDDFKQYEEDWNEGMLDSNTAFEMGLMNPEEEKEWLKENGFDSDTPDLPTSSARGTRSDWKYIDWQGIVPSITEGIVVGAANQALQKHQKNAIRKEYTGAMKRMPGYKPVVSTNLNPLISKFDKNKASYLSKVAATNAALSDQRLRLGNAHAHISNMTDREDNLYDNISKQIESNSARNIELQKQYEAEERNIADANEAISAQAASKLEQISGAYKKQLSDNIVKQIAEARTQYDQYLQGKNKVDNWDSYVKLYNEWDNEADPDRKKKLEEKLTVFKSLMDLGAYRNPYTGMLITDQLKDKLKIK